MTIFIITPARQAYWASMRLKRGLGTPRWKGLGASISAFHKWLTSQYGQADHCEHAHKGPCRGIFEWCKRRGKQYSHNRSHYIQLCRLHHRRYDLTPAKIAQAVKNLVWFKTTS